MNDIQEEDAPVTAPLYLDHAATTPLRPEVLAAMEPWLTAGYGNASTVYRLGREARAALDEARDTVAAILGIPPGEVIFTSGGTESDNAAIKGVYLAGGAGAGHLLASAIEHHAVLHPLEELAQHFGAEAELLPVTREGLVDPEVVRRAIRPDTRLISVMWANNEIGTIQPVAEIGAIAREHRIPFHVDAVQAVGALPVDLTRAPIDLLSLSAHKFYGPKGIGALLVRRGSPWVPLLTGGGQERNRRAGTENVAAIVGLARALELAEAERTAEAARLAVLRDGLFRRLQAEIRSVRRNGHATARLPNNVNVSFAGVDGEALLEALDLRGVMASSGSACTSGSLDPSHVLLALGLSPGEVQSSLRLTLGRGTTATDIDRLLAILAPLVARLRAARPPAA